MSKFSVDLAKICCLISHYGVELDFEISGSCGSEGEMVKFVASALDVLCLFSPIVLRTVFVAVAL